MKHLLSRMKNGLVALLRAMKPALLRKTVAVTVTACFVFNIVGVQLGYALTQDEINNKKLQLKQYQQNVYNAGAATKPSESFVHIQGSKVMQGSTQIGQVEFDKETGDVQSVTISKSGNAAALVMVGDQAKNWVSEVKQRYEKLFGVGKGKDSTATPNDNKASSSQIGVQTQDQQKKAEEQKTTELTAEQSWTQQQEGQTQQQSVAKTESVQVQKGPEKTEQQRITGKKLDPQSVAITNMKVIQDESVAANITLIGKNIDPDDISKELAASNGQPIIVQLKNTNTSAETNGQADILAVAYLKNGQVYVSYPQDGAAQETALNKLNEALPGYAVSGKILKNPAAGEQGTLNAEQLRATAGAYAKELYSAAVSETATGTADATAVLSSVQGQLYGSIVDKINTIDANTDLSEAEKAAQKAALFASWGVTTDGFGVTGDTLTNLATQAAGNISEYLASQGADIVNCAIESLISLFSLQGASANTTALASDAILADIIAGNLDLNASGPMQLSMYAMQQAAAKNGLDLSGYTLADGQTSLDDLAALVANGQSVIAHMDQGDGLGHFVVISSDGNGGITITDPTKPDASQEELLADFKAKWTGNVLATDAAVENASLSEGKVTKTNNPQALMALKGAGWLSDAWNWVSKTATSVVNSFTKTTTYSKTVEDTSGNKVQTEVKATSYVWGLCTSYSTKVTTTTTAKNTSTGQPETKSSTTSQDGFHFFNGTAQSLEKDNSKSTFGNVTIERATTDAGQGTLSTTQITLKQPDTDNSIVARQHEMNVGGEVTALAATIYSVQTGAATDFSVSAAMTQAIADANAITDGKSSAFDNFVMAYEAANANATAAGTTNNAVVENADGSTTITYGQAQSISIPVSGGTQTIDIGKIVLSKYSTIQAIYDVDGNLLFDDTSISDQGFGYDGMTGGVYIDSLATDNGATVVERTYISVEESGGNYSVDLKKTIIGSKTVQEMYDQLSYNSYDTDQLWKDIQAGEADEAIILGWMYKEIDGQGVYVNESLSSGNFTNVGTVTTTVGKDGTVSTSGVINLGSNTDGTINIAYIDNSVDASGVATTRRINGIINADQWTDGDLSKWQGANSIILGEGSFEIDSSGNRTELSGAMTNIAYDEDSRQMTSFTLSNYTETVTSSDGTSSQTVYNGTVTREFFSEGDSEGSLSMVNYDNVNIVVSTKDQGSSAWSVVSDNQVTYTIKYEETLYSVDGYTEYFTKDELKDELGDDLEKLMEDDEWKGKIWAVTESNILNYSETSNIGDASYSGDVRARETNDGSKTIVRANMSTGAQEIHVTTGESETTYIDMSTGDVVKITTTAGQETQTTVNPNGSSKSVTYTGAVTEKILYQNGAALTTPIIIEQGASVETTVVAADKSSFTEKVTLNQTQTQGDSTVVITNNYVFTEKNSDGEVVSRTSGYDYENTYQGTSVYELGSSETSETFLYNSDGSVSRSFTTTTTDLKNAVQTVETGVETGTFANGRADDTVVVATTTKYAINDDGTIDTTTPTQYTPTYKKYENGELVTYAAIEAVQTTNASGETVTEYRLSTTQYMADDYKPAEVTEALPELAAGETGVIVNTVSKTWKLSAEEYAALIDGSFTGKSSSAQKTAWASLTASGAENPGELTQDSWTREVRTNYTYDDRNRLLSYTYTRTFIDSTADEPKVHTETGYYTVAYTESDVATPAYLAGTAATPAAGQQAVTVSPAQMVAAGKTFKNTTYTTTDSVLTIDGVTNSESNGFIAPQVTQGNQYSYAHAPVQVTEPSMVTIDIAAVNIIDKATSVLPAYVSERDSFLNTLKSVVTIVAIIASIAISIFVPIGWVLVASLILAVASGAAIAAISYAQTGNLAGSIAEGAMMAVSVALPGVGKVVGAAAKAGAAVSAAANIAKGARIATYVMRGLSAGTMAVSAFDKFQQGDIKGGVIDLVLGACCAFGGSASSAGSLGTSVHRLVATSLYALPGILSKRGVNVPTSTGNETLDSILGFVSNAYISMVFSQAVMSTAGSLLQGGKFLAGKLNIKGTPAASGTAAAANAVTNDAAQVAAAVKPNRLISAVKMGGVLGLTNTVFSPINQYVSEGSAENIDLSWQNALYNFGFGFIAGSIFGGIAASQTGSWLKNIGKVLEQEYVQGFSLKQSIANGLHLASFNVMGGGDLMTLLPSYDAASGTWRLPWEAELDANGNETGRLNAHLLSAEERFQSGLSGFKMGSILGRWFQLSLTAESFSGKLGNVSRGIADSAWLNPVANALERMSMSTEAMTQTMSNLHMIGSIANYSIAGSISAQVGHLVGQGVDAATGRTDGYWAGKLGTSFEGLSFFFVPSRGISEQESLQNAFKEGQIGLNELNAAFYDGKIQVTENGGAYVRSIRMEPSALADFVVTIQGVQDKAALGTLVKGSEAKLENLSLAELTARGLVIDMVQKGAEGEVLRSNLRDLGLSDVAIVQVEQAVQQARVSMAKAQGVSGEQAAREAILSAGTAISDVLKEQYAILGSNVSTNMKGVLESHLQTNVLPLMNITNFNDIDAKSADMLAAGKLVMSNGAVLDVSATGAFTEVVRAINGQKSQQALDEIKQMYGTSSTASSELLKDLMSIVNEGKNGQKLSAQAAELKAELQNKSIKADEITSLVTNEVLLRAIVTGTGESITLNVDGKTVSLKSTEIAEIKEILFGAESTYAQRIADYAARAERGKGQIPLKGDANLGSVFSDLKLGETIGTLTVDGVTMEANMFTLARVKHLLLMRQQPAMMAEGVSTEALVKYTGELLDAGLETAIGKLSLVGGLLTENQYKAYTSAKTSFESMVTRISEGNMTREQLQGAFGEELRQMMVLGTGEGKTIVISGLAPCLKFINSMLPTADGKTGSLTMLLADNEINTKNIENEMTLFYGDSIKKSSFSYKDGMKDISPDTVLITTYADLAFQVGADKKANAADRLFDGKLGVLLMDEADMALFLPQALVSDFGGEETMQERLDFFKSLVGRDPVTGELKETALSKALNEAEQKFKDYLVEAENKQYGEGASLVKKYTDMLTLITELKAVSYEKMTETQKKAYAELVGKELGGVIQYFEQKQAEIKEQVKAGTVSASLEKNIETYLTTLRSMASGESASAQQQKLLETLSSVYDIALKERIKELVAENRGTQTEAFKKLQQIATELAANKDIEKYAESFKTIEGKENEQLEGYSLDLVLKNIMTSRLTWAEGIDYTRIGDKIMLIQHGKAQDLLPEVGLRHAVEAMEGVAITKVAPRSHSSTAIIDAINSAFGAVGFTGTYSLAARSTMGFTERAITASTNLERSGDTSFMVKKLSNLSVEGSFMDVYGSYLEKFNEAVTTILSGDRALIMGMRNEAQIGIFKSYLEAMKILGDKAVNEGVMFDKGELATFDSTVSAAQAIEMADNKSGTYRLFVGVYEQIGRGIDLKVERNTNVTGIDLIAVDPQLSYKSAVEQFVGRVLGNRHMKIVTTSDVKVGDETIGQVCDNIDVKFVTDRITAENTSTGKTAVSASEFAQLFYDKVLSGGGVAAESREIAKSGAAMSRSTHAQVSAVASAETLKTGLESAGITNTNAVLVALAREGYYNGKVLTTQGKAAAYTLLQIMGVNEQGTASLTDEEKAARAVAIRQVIEASGGTASTSRDRAAAALDNMNYLIDNNLVNLVNPQANNISDIIAIGQLIDAGVITCASASDLKALLAIYQADGIGGILDQKAGFASVNLQSGEQALAKYQGALETVRARAAARTVAENKYNKTQRNPLATMSTRLGDWAGFKYSSWRYENAVKAVDTQKDEALQSLLKTGSINPALALLSSQNDGEGVYKFASADQSVQMQRNAGTIAKADSGSKLVSRMTYAGLQSISDESNDAASKVESLYQALYPGKLQQMLGKLTGVSSDTSLETMEEKIVKAGLNPQALVALTAPKLQAAVEGTDYADVKTLLTAVSDTYAQGQSKESIDGLTTVSSLSDGVLSVPAVEKLTSIGNDAASTLDERKKAVALLARAARADGGTYAIEQLGAIAQLQVNGQQAATVNLDEVTTDNDKDTIAIARYARQQLSMLSAELKNESVKKPITDKWQHIANIGLAVAIPTALLLNAPLGVVIGASIAGGLIANRGKAKQTTEGTAAGEQIKTLKKSLGKMIVPTAIGLALWPATGINPMVTSPIITGILSGFTVGSQMVKGRSTAGSRKDTANRLAKIDEILNKDTAAPAETAAADTATKISTMGADEVAAAASEGLSQAQAWLSAFSGADAASRAAMAAELGIGSFVDTGRIADASVELAALIEGGSLNNAVVNCAVQSLAAVTGELSELGVKITPSALTGIIRDAYVTDILLNQLSVSSLSVDAGTPQLSTDAIISAGKGQGVGLVSMKLTDGVESLGLLKGVNADNKVIAHFERENGDGHFVSITGIQDGMVTYFDNTAESALTTVALSDLERTIGGTFSGTIVTGIDVTAANAALMTPEYGEHAVAAGGDVGTASMLLADKPMTVSLDAEKTAQDNVFGITRVENNEEFVAAVRAVLYNGSTAELVTMLNGLADKFGIDRISADGGQANAQEVQAQFIRLYGALTDLAGNEKSGAQLKQECSDTARIVAVAANILVNPAAAEQFNSLAGSTEVSAQQVMDMAAVLKKDYVRVTTALLAGKVGSIALSKTSVTAEDEAIDVAALREAVAVRRSLVSRLTETVRARLSGERTLEDRYRDILANDGFNMEGKIVRSKLNTINLMGTIAVTQSA